MSSLIPCGGAGCQAPDSDLLQRARNWHLVDARRRLALLVSRALRVRHSHVAVLSGLRRPASTCVRDERQLATRLVPHFRSHRQARNSRSGPFLFFAIEKAAPLKRPGAIWAATVEKGDRTVEEMLT